METSPLTPVRVRAFTLIEVLAALAVIAVAMTALLSASARMAGNQLRLEEISFASWAADTVLTETRLNEPFPATGRRTGQSLIGRYRFRWDMVVQATPEPAIRRIDLHLFRIDAKSEAAPIYSLTGFAGQP